MIIPNFKLKITQLLPVMVLLMFTLSSCDDEWLSEKRDIKLVVPSSLKDMRALLNNSGVFMYDNRGMADPLADDYFVLSSTLDRYSEPITGMYKWEIDPFYGGYTQLLDWDNSYHQVFVTNIVLEGLKELVPLPSEQEEWNSIKGNALLYRARAFYNLAQLFCAPYNAQNLEKPGIHLRLGSNVQAPIVRSTVSETYDQIIKDFKGAASLLGEEAPVKMDGSKAVAYGLLARTYLAIADYENALAYADSCLQNYDVLLDYNSLDPGDRYPFSMFNEETILYGYLYPNYPLTSISNGLVDSTLYDSYDDNDLRKQLYFRPANGGVNFRGSYTGSAGRFSGLATDEVLLIRAECYARAGETDKALEDLNSLLEKRYITGTFTPLEASGAEEALEIILKERQKELLFRGSRWTDLRRLNNEPGFAKTLKRAYEDEVYALEPNSSGYTVPIPQYVIENTGIQQN